MGTTNCSKPVFTFIIFPFIYTSLISQYIFDKRFFIYLYGKRKKCESDTDTLGKFLIILCKTIMTLSMISLENKNISRLASTGTKCYILKCQFFGEL